MKALLSIIFGATLASSLACAENFTETNTDKAKEVIAAAVEAHGGSALLSDLHTLIIETETINHSVDQSRGTEKPWDTNVSQSVDVIDLDNSIFVNDTENDGGGFQSHNATIINGEESYQLNYRAGTVARIAEPDFATTSGPFVRVTPAALIRTLNNRAANAHYLGDTEVDGVSYDVIGFSMTVGPAISMYFHKETHLLHRSERVFPGFGLVEYEFIDYTDTDGVPFNQSFRLYLNGDENLVRTIKSMKINESIEQYLTIDASLVAIPAVEPDLLARQEVADGVWLIGGAGTYAMFVDMGDYIFAAGGTAGIPDRIELLREVVGDKPISYSMMTHHHFDHVVGVSAYEAEGATLIGSAAHEKIIRRAAENGDALKFEGVTDNMTLETGDRRVEIIDLGPTAHTEHLLVAYLPEEGILFEADHFAMPRVGPVPPAVTSTRTFAEALAGKELNITKILSAHSSKAGTMDDLKAALEAEIFMSRR
jgi:glyoxylase-like metal-dependent hydrolase (beta-lactamase superfamily II)